MGSSKTAQLLITEYNYRKNGYTTVLIKPSIDTRDSNIRSRIGLERECDIFTKEDNLCKIEIFPVTSSQIILLVDEVQFCTKEQIEQLQRMGDKITVICYGLKTDYKTKLFEASKRLIEIADEIEELPHICECGKKAIINGLFIENKLQTQGETIHIGDSEYKPLCYKCYKRYRDAAASK